MSEYKFRYYVAEGVERQALDEYVAETVAFNEAANDLAKEVGADKSVRKRGISGFTFDGTSKPDPAVWKFEDWIGGQSYYRPLKKTKLGREISAKMAAIKPPNFSSKIGDDGTWTTEVSPRGGIVIRYIGWDWIGNIAILTVPSESKWEPKDSAPIKVSEYFAMKEDAAARAEVKP